MLPPPLPPPERSLNMYIRPSAHAVHTLTHLTLHGARKCNSNEWEKNKRENEKSARSLRWALNTRHACRRSPMIISLGKYDWRVCVWHLRYIFAISHYYTSIERSMLVARCFRVASDFVFWCDDTNEKCVQFNFDDLFLFFNELGNGNECCAQSVCVSESIAVTHASCIRIIAERIARARWLNAVMLMWMTI